MPQLRAPRQRPLGFTLVELLVALFALSILAVLSWRGLDGMTRAQAYTQERADQVLTLQTGLAQWQADLDAIIQLPRMSALEWNGRLLRMVRRSPAGGQDGVVVTAWTRRVDGGRGSWLRWQSQPLTRRDQVDAAWQQADQWSQNAGVVERAREVAVFPLDDWQVFFYRADAWTNPLSSDAPSASATPRTPGAGAADPAQARGGDNTPGLLPDGVRVVLSLPAGGPIPGNLTIDWVSPRVGGDKS